MRDTRSLLLLLVSLMLVLVSFVLLWTWGYRFTNKNDEAKTENRPTVIPVIDSLAIVNKVRDSLQKVYNITLQDLDAQLDSSLTNADSLRNELDFKLGEFYRLRNEITMLLKNRNNGNDFQVAKQKISELQARVQDFKDKNQDVENENNKLSNILEQLSKNNNKSNSNAKQTVNGNKSGIEKTETVFPVFTASDVRLSALATAGEDEVETTAAARTNKFAGSFTVTNFNSQFTNAEVVVVVKQPNGNVLKVSDWETGTFNTPEGKKIYSYKLSFNYTRGEAKRLQFFLKTNNLQKGNYTMEVYYNGLLIGKTTKTLS